MEGAMTRARRKRMIQDNNMEDTVTQARQKRKEQDNNMEDTVTQARQERKEQDNNMEDTVTQDRQKRKKQDNNMEDTVTQARQKRKKQGDRVEDTVVRARMVREKQGALRDTARDDREKGRPVVTFLARAVTSCPCEVEVNFVGEADLHQHEKGCEKNPDHKRFIPVDEFTVDHPDYDFHGNHLLDLVRAVIDLTVRVSVKYVSEERPKTVSGTDIPFPCYSYRGTNRMMTGTGWVCDVQIFPDCTNDNSCQFQERQNSQPTKPCPCPECMNSPSPKTQYAFIYIRTSAHVVFDDTEAEHTTCHLFYDRGRTPDLCDGAVALKGMSVVWITEARDVCEMRHVTHDLDLAAKLKTMVSDLEEFGDSDYKFDRLESKKDKSASLVVEPFDGKTIIVSHPHGCSKQVSVGRYMGRDYFNGTSKISSLSPIKYDTATCSGSSGAFLIVVKDRRFFYWGNNLVHFGFCEEMEDMNRSCRFFV